MHRQTGQGREQTPPALLCMVLLIQGHVGAADAEAVELALMDLRWQNGPGWSWRNRAAFLPGLSLQQFRDRMIRNDKDRRLLERTVEVAKKQRNSVVRSRQSRCTWPRIPAL